jgi:hypothetical protein
MKKLGQHPPGDRLNGRPLPVVQTRQPGPVSLQLSLSQFFSSVSQRRYDRSCLPVGSELNEPLDLLSDDLIDGADLLATLSHAGVGEGFEIVHVEEGDARQVANGRIDIAGDRDVDDQQGSPLPSGQNGLKVVGVEQEIGSPRRCEQEVGLFEGGGHVAECKRPPAHLLR